MLSNLRSTVGGLGLLLQPLSDPLPAVGDGQQRALAGEDEHVA